MSNKLITDAGKTELLRLGFKAQEAGGAFSFIALGGDSSTGAQGSAGKFAEVSGYDYERVETTVDSLEDKTITISGTFTETNYAPTDGSGTIKEIGLCNSDVIKNEEIFFMYAEVPKIIKTGDISLQYTIVISID